jgi:DNA-binding transcriptional MerR regulator
MDLFSKLFKVTAESIYELDKQYRDGSEYWPFHPDFLEKLVAPLLFQELLRIFRKLKEKGYTLKDISQIIKNPAQISNYQSLWLQNLKNVTYEEKCELLEDFLKLLIILRNGEPYCENGRNLVWSKNELNEEMEKYKKYFKDVNEKMRTLLSRLDGLLVLYAESIYYYRVDFSRMMHGPYYWNGLTIFVKEYFHLKQDNASPFPFDHYKEIGIYKNIKVKVSFFGHTYVQPSFPEALKSFIILIDGNLIKDFEELKELYNKVELAVEREIKVLEEKINDKKFLLERGVKSFFYPLKPLYNELGEDWKTPLSKINIDKFLLKPYRPPPPWGDWDKDKIVSFLIKKMDFRKSKSINNL